MSRIERILCGIDFSECSRRAFETAAALARATRARMTALHVHELPPPEYRPYVGPEGLAPFPVPALDRERVIAEMRAFLRLDRLPDGSVHVELAEAPAVAAELLAQAARLSADLIALGTHGRSPLARLLLGSVADKILRTAWVPVLAVPLTARTETPADIRRILCAVDFSECSAAALQEAAVLAAATGAALTVLHVVEAPAGTLAPSATGAARRRVPHVMGPEARRKLHEFIPPWVRDRCGVNEWARYGRAAPTIGHVAREIGTDLLVVGTHGRSAVSRLIAGSTTDRIVRQAICPVIAVPPTSQSASAAA